MILRVTATPMAVTLFLLCCSIGAMAADNDTFTNHLYKACRTTLLDYDRDPSAYVHSPEDHNSTFCSQFLAGFLSGLLEGGDRFRMSETNGDIQLTRSFVNYVTVHPLEMDSPTIAKVVIKAWLADRIITKVKSPASRR